MDGQAKAQRLLISDLLDRCGDCPRRYITTHPDSSCGTCSLYAEIRAAGTKLAEMEHKATPEPAHKLTLRVPQYHGYRNRGMTDDQIAEALSVAVTTLRRWKHVHGIRTGRIITDEALIAQAYQEGHTLRYIAKTYHCGHDRLNSILEKRRIKKRRS
jgi:hypothetical protein